MFCERHMHPLNILNRKNTCPTSIILSAILLFTGNTYSEPSGNRQFVSRHRDLPRHQYAVKTTVDNLYHDKAELKDLAQSVKSDISDTLQKYKISDPAEEVQLRAVLVKADIILGDVDDALKQISEIAKIPARDSSKTLSVFPLKEILISRRHTGDDNALFIEMLKKELQQTLNNQDWNATGQAIARFAGFLEVVHRIYSTDSTIKHIDHSLEANLNHMPATAAYALLDARTTEDLILPYKSIIAQTCRQAIKKNATSPRNIWPERAVRFKKEDGLTPVTVAIWDGGVDTSVFKDQLWINPNEEVDGIDNDNNGFIDDVNGIAHDLYGEKMSELLPDCYTEDIPIPKLKSILQGYLDLYAGVETEEAENLRQISNSVDQATLESLFGSLYGLSDYSHGTHVAGIAAEGNPFIKMLVVRCDYHSDPFCPSAEVARAHAKAQEETLNYCKKAGVRVINMSWSESLPITEWYIERSYGGKTPAERLRKAEEYFDTINKSLYKIISESPDILFVTSAGNTNQNVDFEELIPSIYDLPNLIAVGSIDKAGNPPTNSSYGKRVRLHANGVNVDSFIVGGSRMRISGTSMASPGVTNLAAKMLAIDPSLTPQEIIQLMEKNGDTIPGTKENFLIHPQRTIQALKAKR